MEDIKYEVVCTKHYLDIGLLIEVDSNNKPKRVRARSTTYSPKGEYGGIHYVRWIKTGVFVTEKEWNKISFNKPTGQLLRELGIKKRRKESYGKEND